MIQYVLYSTTQSSTLGQADGRKEQDYSTDKNNVKYSIICNRDGKAMVQYCVMIANNRYDVKKVEICSFVPVSHR